MLGGGGGGGEEVGPPTLLGSGGENEASQGGGEERGSGGGLFGGGNRWPRQETLALLKIRSDMDTAFRDSSAKGPLWEEVSRKLDELGYHRSAKKCKEKFENVYKYHKRTREGRTGKQDGKTYRFFDQLEAFDSHSPAPPPQHPRANVVPQPALPVSAPTNPPGAAVPSFPTQNVAQNIVPGPLNYVSSDSLPGANPTAMTIPPPATNPSNPFQAMSKDLHSHSTSSSTFSDEGLRGGGGAGDDGRRHKKKRKWKDFFERLMKEAMDKQEELQNKFLEAIEKREHERLVREESWREQEMARIYREREILAQERSMAAAKDSAVMAFLQKIAEQQPGLGKVQNTNTNSLRTANAPAPVPPPPQPTPQLQLQPVSLPVQTTPPPQPSASIEFRKSDNGDSYVPTLVSSSRWPKVEVQALIRLRTNLDCKYQENGPKGPLWEEISSQMRKLGYERSAKRCKEKWENINKYYKKVKESNKKRREDSKTCPYFQQLETIYQERSSKIMDMAPLMVTPEQQWPPQQDQPSHPDLAMDDVETSEQMDHNLDEDHDDGDDDEEEDGGEYEIVAANKPSSNGDTQ